MGPTEPTAAVQGIEPDPDDGVAAALWGTVLWLAAGAACLLVRDRLAAHGAQWWIATCAVGALLGLPLMAYTRRRAEVYRSHQGSAAAPDAEPGPRTS